jgi:hypothetical protein
MANAIGNVGRLRLRGNVLIHPADGLLGLFAVASVSLLVAPTPGVVNAETAAHDPAGYSAQGS